jgi:hypothetical protein
MKGFVILVATLLISMTIFSQAVWAEKKTCSNLWIVNNTVASQVPSSVDLLFVDKLERRLKSTEGFCYRGYAKMGEWQAQSRQKNDMLLEFNLGTLDDANGVGGVGKHIEVVSYSIFAYDSNVGRSINLGSQLTWFSTTHPDQYDLYMHNVIANVVFSLNLSAIGTLGPR